MVSSTDRVFGGNWKVVFLFLHFSNGSFQMNIYENICENFGFFHFYWCTRTTVINDNHLLNINRSTNQNRNQTNSRRVFFFACELQSNGMERKWNINFMHSHDLFRLFDAKKKQTKIRRQKENKIKFYINQ